MPYLMNINFDNSSRLCRDTYYFEYKSVVFKLIQNNIRKHRDTLLTIVRDDEAEKEKAYDAASEFLSALAWENNARIKLSHAGGAGRRDNFRLRQARCFIRDYPQIPFGGYHVGYDICIIPQIENGAQREALTLFREANSSNNNFLSFLFFYQVMEVDGKIRASDWINSALKNSRNRIRLSESELTRLPLNGKSLGEYLYDDCRNAIAHINRQPGRTRIQIDRPEDNRRISMSLTVVREFARCYISEYLVLKKCLYLVKIMKGRYPVYIDEATWRKTGGKIAYKRLSFEEAKKKKWH